MFPVFSDDVIQIRIRPDKIKTCILLADIKKVVVGDSVGNQVHHYLSENVTLSGTSLPGKHLHQAVAGECFDL